jgi:hypothetical protein
VGGIGSGRRGGTATIESTASYILELKSLVSSFREGQFQAQDVYFDEGRFAIAVIVDLTNEWDCFLELIHRTRDRQDHEGSVITDRVQLTRTEPTFGGHRWWFLCPRTGRRTIKLFLPNGGRHFWSRDAYRLGYACQREDRFSRLQRRAAKLTRELGGDGQSTWFDPPQKPKWMRRRTFERKLERWAQVVEQANGTFDQKGLSVSTPPSTPVGCASASSSGAARSATSGRRILRGSRQREGAPYGGPGAVGQPDRRTPL